MVMTKKKSVTITQKNKIKKSKNNNAKRHQNMKKDSRVRNKEQ